MSVNLNTSGLGKFAGMHGTIFKSEIAAAKPSKQIVGKGIGKGCNYPMDSDELCVAAHSRAISVQCKGAGCRPPLPLSFATHS